jgi:hypothetical protein
MTLTSAADYPGLAVDSDASVLVTHLDPGRSVHHVISPARGGYADLIA